MSRQRTYQNRMRFEGRCIICGSPAIDSRRKNNANGKSPYCLRHQRSYRERERKRQGSDRRYLHAGSYKGESDGNNQNDDTNDG